METNKRSLTFHINNLSYTIDIGSSEFADDLEKELLDKLSPSKHIDTKTLFLLYVQHLNESLEYKNEVNKIINKLSDYEQKD